MRLLRACARLLAPSPGPADLSASMPGRVAAWEWKHGTAVRARRVVGDLEGRHPLLAGVVLQLQAQHVAVLCLAVRCAALAVPLHAQQSQRAALLTALGAHREHKV